MTKKEKKAVKVVFKPNCQCGGRYGMMHSSDKIICTSCGYKHVATDGKKK